DLIDGSLRAAFEETGMPFQKEIDMMAMAVKKDLFTHAFCATLEHAMQMADVGVPLLVPHMGNSIGGTIGNKTAISLDEACERINKVCEAVKAVHPDVLVICHGGPIANHPEFQYVADNCPGCDGYMGGSSGERFPVETSITAATEKFKAIQRG
ncbi:MAG: phosphoenolpyruvate hydrolase family protein, partial [Oscillospiraceae bacterium]|nr:phosphoenolpyruvate hydrolase family protein [Oscillospiraceae bacterium]